MTAPIKDRFDVIDRKLNVDDFVTWSSNYGVWKIIKFNPKTVSLLPAIAPKSSYRRNKARYAYHTDLTLLPSMRFYYGY